MRPALGLLLVALLSACPILCGTAHARDDEGGPAHSHVPRPDRPAPANDDDCACNGAVKSSEARTVAATASPADSPQAAFPFRSLLGSGPLSSNPRDSSRRDAAPRRSPRGSASCPFLRC